MDRCLLGSRRLEVGRQPLRRAHEIARRLSAQFKKWRAATDDLVVLRPAGPDAMAMLRLAAGSTDAALDVALLRIGILAPVDLTIIRSVVTRPAAELVATTNRDGHCIVEVVEDGCSVARIHHDGQVVAASRVAA